MSRKKGEFSIKKEQKILLLGGAISACFLGSALLSNTITKSLFHIALSRNGIKKIEQIPFLRKAVSGFLPDREFMGALKEGARALMGAGAKEVHYSAKDGLPLIGHWLPAKNPKRVIIAMHGWRSHWARDFGMIAPFWQRQGCSVLFAEQRGQGKSGGDCMGFGATERHDCLSWCEWVNRQNKEGLPIYLAGISMGAATVLMAAGLGLPENVHGIIADCGFTSPHEIWKHVAENNLHLRYHLRGYHADHLFQKKLKFAANTFSTIDAMHQNKIPTLLIHGQADHFVPLEMSLQNFDACAAPKHLLIVPKADHGMSYYLDPEGYQRIMVKFFLDYDEK